MYVFYGPKQVFSSIIQYCENSVRGPFSSFWSYHMISISTWSLPSCLGIVDAQISIYFLSPFRTSCPCRLKNWGQKWTLNLNIRHLYESYLCEYKFVRWQSTFQISSSDMENIYCQHHSNHCYVTFDRPEASVCLSELLLLIWWNKITKPNYPAANSTTRFVQSDLHLLMRLHSEAQSLQSPHWLTTHGPAV